jgi:hypothetical protein
MIREAIEHQIGMWTRMRHPALLDMFIRRNGHEGNPQKRPRGYRKRAYKACFKNSAEHVLFRDPSLTYVEGFAISSGIGMLIHHAWMEDTERNVIDLTWQNPEACHYYGVSFDAAALKRLTLEYRHYGLLDTGVGLNAALMFRMDPALEQIIEDMMNRRHAPDACQLFEGCIPIQEEVDATQ